MRRFRKLRMYDSDAELGTGSSSDSTQIELGEDTIDVDVIHAKAEEILKKEKEVEVKAKPPKASKPPKVDNSKEDLLQRALERIEALEQKNINLERDSILGKFDKKALESLKEKGIDISTYSNDELSKTAKLIEAMGVTNKPARVSHGVNPDNGIDAGVSFMEEWNKSKGRK